MFLPVRAGAIGLSTEAAAPIPASTPDPAASTAVSVDGTRSTSPHLPSSSAPKSGAAIPSGSARAASACACDFHRGMSEDQAWSTLP